MKSISVYLKRFRRFGDLNLRSFLGVILTALLSTYSTTQAKTNRHPEVRRRCVDVHVLATSVESLLKKPVAGVIG